MEWLRRIWYLLNRRRLEREMENEMALHRELAGREIGNPLRLREQAREVWGWTWLDRLWQDLAYGARVLRRSPGFTFAAVVVLGLGIGVTLSAVRIVLHEIRPSRAPDPETLLELERAAPGSHGTLVSWPAVSFYAEHARSFRSIMGRTDSSVAVGEESEPASIAFVTANYFAEYGVRPVQGRILLSARDEAPGAEPAALLGLRFWERRLGGDPAVIGQLVRLAGKPVRVVGIVAPPGETMAIWMPLAKQPYLVEGSTLLTDWGSGVHMYGRLNPGIARRAAEEETRALTAGLREQHPKDLWKGEYLEARQSRLNFQEAAAAMVAATLVLLVLIVACTNLGTLLLARGVAREREIRTRMALGADRRRVVRQLFTESALLAALGSAAALFLSSAAFKLMQLRSEAPEDLDAAPDWRVLAATLAIGLIAAVSFGVAPALRLTSLAPREGRSRSVFLAVQVGASCMLLMLSGLLARSFERLMTADPGFDYRQVVVVQPGISDHGYRGMAAQAYMRTLRDRLLSVPGVERVSLMDLAPWGNSVSMENHGGFRVMFNRVDAEFLQTLGLRLSRGRNFLPGEQGVAIISESVARWLWPGEDPLGKSTTLNGGSTVIGVVRTAGTFNLRTEDTLGVYFPPARDWAPWTLVARVSGRPAHYLGTFASAAKSLDSRLTPDVHLLDGQLDRAISDSLKLVATVGSLGTLATLLAAIGLAGLTAYTVGQRTREIGVRIALGARRTQVVQAVLAPMARPVAMGFAGGMLGAAGMSSALRREIFGLHPLDPLAYLMAIALFLVVMVVAAAAPARRAVRVNPADALRHD